ncbi:MAG: hypothetical protein IMF11_09275 [Proteobacteria bacterium]|jgi:hypothetical protein|nr:hypothetical protein [Pseudomonadota bacterium]
MWVVFRSKERRIVGVTADSAMDLDKEDSLKEVVNGLVKPGDVSEYDAIQITDREKAAEYMEAFPDKLVLKGPLTKPQLAIRDPEIFSLYITTDAKDVHPVDGIPEITADGNSFATISIQKIDERYKPQRGPNDDDRIYLRTDHGILRDAEGTNEINSIKLNEGKAVFRLVSEKVKRVATVQMLTANPNLQDTSFRIEFI